MRRTLALLALLFAPLTQAGELVLQDALHRGSGEQIRYGTFTVAENPAEPTGRTIKLTVCVIPAKAAQPRLDPIFYVAGGPGQDATEQIGTWVRHWLRNDRDIVLVSQRGTGKHNRLQCELPGSDDNLQGYLDGFFDPRTFRRCLQELQQRADLTQYSTPQAMDDLNAVRAALGYQQINLLGGSYGSRAILVYLRRHPETVRSAILNSVAPLSFRNPLYHAQSAQAALDEVFARCAADPKCAAAYGDLPQRFEQVMERLERKSAPATVRHPRTGQPERVRVSRSAFATGLRVIMYQDYRRVPLMIHQAHAGNFDLIGQHALERARALRSGLAFGMLMCVTCPEDVARIDPAEIDPLTADTYLGPQRVRDQKRICGFWPHAELPPTYADPVQADVPVLLLSGTLDSVTPPRWGAEAARHLPQGTHVVAPGAHGVRGPCIDQLMRDFLSAPTAQLDTSCVKKMRHSPFELPPPPPDPLP